MRENGAVALIVGCLFCLAGGSSCVATETEELRPLPADGIERQHLFEDVYLASQPSEAAFRAARERGVRTVVNLRPPSEHPDFDEAAMMRELGIEYHNPAFAAPEELTDDVFERTRKLLADRSKRPLLLHCSSANRVGAIWLAYRVLDEGVPLDAALDEAKAVGLRSPELQQRAAEYVRGAASGRPRP